MQHGKSYTGARLAAGLKGEEMALNFLNSLIETIQVIDVSLDKHYQTQDIDFVVMCQNSETILAECKNDSYIASTENVVFEIARIYHDHEPHNTIRQGWSVFSKATLLTIWSEDNQTLYIMTLTNLRKAMQEYTRGHPRLKMIDSDHYYSTLVILIPLDKILHNSYQYEGGTEWYVLTDYGLFFDTTRLEQKPTKGDHSEERNTDIATSYRKLIATFQKVNDILPKLPKNERAELERILKG